VLETLAGIDAPIEMCAVGDGFAWSTKITGIVNGCHRGIVSYKGQQVCELHPALPGEHNLLNATFALATCNACGVEPKRAAEALAKFTGVERRMTEVGKLNGATIVDDYGHHPTEVRATLKALRERYQPKRLFCVFQPHQHSRTRFLLDDFAKSFSSADETIVPDIYFVRDSEAERQRVSADDLVQRVAAQGQKAQHLPKFDQIVGYLKRELRDGDLVVTPLFSNSNITI
jgi:UDP-N-acetylmuramate--alanine ligase